MTNQEPGAPEPLTSEEERAFRAEIAALKRPDYDSFKGRVGRLLATLDRDRAPMSAGLRERALRRATAMAHATGDKFFHRDANAKRGLDPDDWTLCDAPLCAEARAALSHPESVTNQEPGAPEPLTTVAGWLWNAYHADEHEGPRETCPETLCRKARAALSHPESDTREELPSSVRVLGYTIDQLRVAVATASLHDPSWVNRAHPESDTRVPEPPDFSACCGDYLPTGECCAAKYGTARLVDPESDTRGLDVERLGAWFCGTFDHTDHEAFLQWGDVCDEGRADARSAAKYAVSPDLSIDREGLARAVREHREGAGLTLRRLAGLAGIDFTYLSKIENGHDRPSRDLVKRLDRATGADGALIEAFDGLPCPRCGAIRGTTQPEPTE